MNALSKAIICRHLNTATDEIQAMHSPDDGVVWAVIDAQDAALTALYRGRLPGFLVRRAVPKIQRGADGQLAA